MLPQIGTKISKPIIVLSQEVSEFPVCVCVTAWRVWIARRRRVAVGLSGQLRHAVALFPVALRRQPHHQPRHRRHGDGLSGLPGRHQGEQVPAAEREYWFSHVVFRQRAHIYSVSHWHKCNTSHVEPFVVQFFIVLLIILLAELILLILFFVYTDKVRPRENTQHPYLFIKQVT